MRDLKKAGTADKATITAAVEVDMGQALFKKYPQVLCFAFCDVYVLEISSRMCGIIL